MDGNIINLHISYLPWNREASPNFWSFVDDTPKDVTIHRVNAELDKGKIIYRKQCYFDIQTETFASTYEKLNLAIVELFVDKWQYINCGKYPLQKQCEKGSYHSSRDLKETKKRIQFEWRDNIAEFLGRYKLLQKEVAVREEPVER